MRRSAAAIGEEFPYCVKAAGFADGGAASGRSRPTPPPVGGSLVYAAELLSLVRRSCPICSRISG